MHDLPFRDRKQAGRLLSRKLRAYANREDVLVLGLPRGGVPVAFEVARSLHAPLDAFLVRKLGELRFCRRFLDEVSAIEDELAA